MAKFRVTLARLVRETKTIEVEAESAEAIDTEALYEEDDGTDFEADMEWGAEEGTHHVLPMVAPPPGRTNEERNADDAFYDAEATREP